MQTLLGNQIVIQNTSTTSLEDILCENRGIPLSPEGKKEFFNPTLSLLHDPFLIPDMEKAVDRILLAKERGEIVAISWDYDVDGVSSTAILVRFLNEIGIKTGKKLPHRINDGYGLKEYFFDDFKEKNVSLVITVDCGTRDIEPIRYGKSIWIDVIVTDHHAVPEIIPDEVIGILNPKRHDSQYPFRELAGAGVAWKLIHGILIKLYGQDEYQSHKSILNPHIEKILQEYSDFAALGTVSDCMPLRWENRTITTLWLRQLAHSRSIGLRKFLLEKWKIEKNADIIGFQIGPRINAAGRMDHPDIALSFLLASEKNVDGIIETLEWLNETRREYTKKFVDDALLHVDTKQWVLIYSSDSITHGIIWLVAGKLTEEFWKPSIVLVDEWDHYVASCRSPSWCNIVELLTDCKDCFVRFWWHGQAAGFTLEKECYSEFLTLLNEAYYHRYSDDIPKKTQLIESRLSPSDLNPSILETLEKFAPYGIGNPRPYFILENLTLLNVGFLGKEEKHLTFTFQEMPHIRCIAWWWGEHASQFHKGDILSPIVEIQKNEWNGNISVQCILQDCIIA